MCTDQRHNVNADIGLPCLRIYVYIPLEQTQHCNHKACPVHQIANKQQAKDFLSQLPLLNRSPQLTVKVQGRDQKALHQVKFSLDCCCITRRDSAAAFALRGVLTVLYLE